MGELLEKTKKASFYNLEIRRGGILLKQLF
nr:MAG TPA: hypothetical protein [Caudoviricetes sp.]